MAKSTMTRSQLSVTFTGGMESIVALNILNGLLPASVRNVNYVSNYEL